MIPKYYKDHEESDGSHDCKLLNHRCNFTCPECKSFCNKDYDHEGNHNTNAHRNKEFSVFVNTSKHSKIAVVVEGKKREYKVGDSCQPENCTQSCARKGRAHYHLKECSGPETCEAKANSHVRHSVEKYHPFEHKVFDMWLCEDYWKSLNWDPPVEPAQVEEIKSCNFICCHKSHGEEKTFCNKRAWHSDDHRFDCEHKGAFSTDIIDIVFCSDNTGSMGSYIEKSKDTIKRIIKDVSIGSRSVKFGYVGYRDHPPQDDTYVTILKDLGDESNILSYLSSVSAAGGGDGPEAVMDGLYDSIFKISWRKDSMRFIFHIADAPPHGTEYTGGSGDGFASGCPCGINIGRLAGGLKEKIIKYKLLKIGSYPNKMADIFKRSIEDYEESDLDGASYMESKVSEIIIKEIKNEELDIMG